MTLLNRREAIKAGAVLIGAAFTSSGVLASCGGGEREAGREAAREGVLDANDGALMTEIADTLLPDTPASPGARAAGAGPAIQLLLSDCYEPAEQQRLTSGLHEFRAKCRARQGADFTALPRATRERLLRELDAEARVASAPHWFGLAREVAERAYWSSETGMTRALRYVHIPGRFEGCIPLAKEQPAWG